MQEEERWCDTTAAIKTQVFGPCSESLTDTAD